MNGSNDNIRVDPESPLPVLIAYGTAAVDEHKRVRGWGNRASGECVPRPFPGAKRGEDGSQIDLGFTWEPPKMREPNLWANDLLPGFQGIRYLKERSSQKPIGDPMP